MTAAGSLRESSAIAAASQGHDYRGRSVALLTKHGKASVIAPVLAGLELTVVSSEGFDTDALGTFSGEVERTLSPFECAHTKARMACDLTGLDIGLGSEGSFGGGPMPGLLNWDDELLVWHDASNGFDILARAAGPVMLAPIEVESLEALQQQFRGYDPQQAWIMRTQDNLIKGLYGEVAILAHLQALSLVSQQGRLKIPVRIEPDLRAMHCPQRQHYIRQAAQQLVDRLQSHCPACALPNFWPDMVERGLPCGDCGAPTRLPKAYIRRCNICLHEIREPSTEQYADPGDCDWCNP
jgi:hypothetical protein